MNEANDETSKTSEVTEVFDVSIRQLAIEGINLTVDAVRTFCIDKLGLREGDFADPIQDADKDSYIVNIHQGAIDNGRHAEHAVTLADDLGVGYGEEAA